MFYEPEYYFQTELTVCLSAEAEADRSQRNGKLQAHLEETFRWKQLQHGEEGRWALKGIIRTSPHYLLCFSHRTVLLVMVYF